MLAFTGKKQNMLLYTKVLIPLKKDYTLLKNMSSLSFP
jgi:hypothetical protein